MLLTPHFPSSPSFWGVGARRQLYEDETSARRQDVSVANYDSWPRVSSTWHIAIWWRHDQLRSWLHQLARVDHLHTQIVYDAHHRGGVVHDQPRHRRRHQPHHRFHL